ncbi:hypothetical protein, partial [Gordonibacter sp.]|uniref:hypothetical protein n=1 Tax=Gordonibacter sp. TaxID=1968902 RepID=UPI002FCA6FDA
ALMAIPNIVAILLLSGLVTRETRHYVYDNHTAEINDDLKSQRAPGACVRQSYNRDQRRSHSAYREQVALDLGLHRGAWCPPVPSVVTSGPSFVPIMHIVASKRSVRW